MSSVIARQPTRTDDARHTERNRLLQYLPTDTYARLSPYLEETALRRGDLLFQRSHAEPYVHFPQTCVVSMAATAGHAGSVEIATIGREGGLGLSVVHDADFAISTALTQIPGVVKRITAERVRAIAADSPTLARVLRLHTYALFGTVAQTAACNRLHSVSERLARWLLMMHDRIDGDRLPLTQLFIAQMLGARRPTVNMTIAAFEQAGFIVRRRGAVEILDRGGLERVTCECYQIIRELDRRLFGALPVPQSGGRAIEG